MSDGTSRPPGIHGEIVRERFAYDGGRGVSVYVPARRAEAIVFAADGEAIAAWGALPDDEVLPPTMIVGVHHAADETQRLHEYSPRFDSPRFAAHERFFALEVASWVRERFGVALPAERTAVYGASAGAELALALGVAHPRRYGVVLAASPGAGFRPPADLCAPLPRTYLVAGTQEPFFRDNARRWADAFVAAQADVVMFERDSGHDAAMWRAELPRMLAWAFAS